MNRVSLTLNCYILILKKSITSLYGWFVVLAKGTQGPKLGAQGTLEFSCGSLKFLQAAQRCPGVSTQHLWLAFGDATWLPGLALHT